MTIVIPVDEPPVAVAEYFSVTKDVPQKLDVLLSNDTDEQQREWVIIMRENEQLKCQSHESGF